MPLDSLPCPYCPERRDAQLGVLLDFVSVRESAGERVVLAGDFNLSQREAAYRELRFLQDAGRGLTWRPLAVSWLPALLRLDYILVGQGIGVVASSSDCAGSGSDHCPIFAVLTLTE
jgi:endonuclease/exonuclease/phosphatase family metal-dependent hydrolase